MAEFPQLEPSVRTFSPDAHPVTPLRSLNGFEGRVLHSSKPLNAALSLVFWALDEQKLLQILSHYQGQKGSFLSFDLPDEAWSGIEHIQDVSPSGYQWRYVQPPQVEELPTGQHNVTVSLLSVPYAGAKALGANLTITLGLTTTPVVLPVHGSATGANLTIDTAITGGAATASKFATATGAALTITAAVQGGAATAEKSVTAPGAALTITTSVTGGTASAGHGAIAPGAALTITASIAGGTASAGHSATAPGATLTITASVTAAPTTGASGPTTPADPLFDKVMLLLHADDPLTGAHPIDVVDSSKYNRTVTAHNLLAYDTTTSKHGTSFKFPNTASGTYAHLDYLEFEIPEWTSGGQWTFEFWFKLEDKKAIYTFFNEHNQTSFTVYTANITTGQAITVRTGASTSHQALLDPAYPWQHFALTIDFDTKDIHGYLDGVEFFHTATQVPTITKPLGLYVGLKKTSPSYERLNLRGHIDEFRITQAIRYTGNFTPSPDPFPDHGP